MSQETSMGGDRRAFEPTAWTLVLKARDERQLELLIDSYWKPCYFYLRRRGRGVEEAKDLTQGFFTHILEKDALAQVSRSKGRFRSFLLACLDHYVADEEHRGRALKRGGKMQPLDFERAESEFSVSGGKTPEEAFRRKWALDTLERALKTLEAEMGDRFSALREYITIGRPGNLRELASRLGMSESNVKVTLHRARTRYGEILRGEVTRTLETPGDFEDELRELFAALS